MEFAQPSLPMRTSALESVLAGPGSPPAFCKDGADDHLVRSINPYEAILAVDAVRAQVIEAHAARDAVVAHLSTAARSVQEKASMITRLQKEKHELEDKLLVLEKSESTERKRQTSAAIKQDKENKTDNSALSPKYEDIGISDAYKAHAPCTPPATPTPVVGPAFPRLTCLIDPEYGSAPPSPVVCESSQQVTARATLQTMHDDSPEAMKMARHTILTSLPIPDGIPDGELKPIALPPNLAVQDFLRSMASSSHGSSLSKYEILQDATTHWCPEREEHGYYLAPLFKCTTNPRVSTAHCWSAVNVLSKMSEPTECFYSKGGKCYYAGVYKAIRLADLAPSEWEQLTSEASQALIKETVIGRKNVSPQNIYEISQLYVAGALRVACVGLQCVGFNDELYNAALDHASFCTQASRWRTPLGQGPNTNTSGLQSGNVPLPAGLYTFPSAAVGQSSIGKGWPLAAPHNLGAASPRLFSLQANRAIGASPF